MRIFISYARIDARDQAKQLYDQLAGAGHKAFLDMASLQAGRSWTHQLEQEIEAADTVVALLTHGSFRSDICRAEQLRALRLNRRVIPVRVHPDCDIPLHLEGTEYLAFDPPLIERALLNGTPAAALKVAYRETRVTRPALPPGLVKRSNDLERLRAALIREKPDRYVALVALKAQGGIGKSVLANMALDDPIVQAAYPDGLVWLQLGQNITEPQVLERIQESLAVLTPEKRLPTTITAASNEFRTALRTSHALIVLDDLWDASHLKWFVFHEAANATILITTRDENVVRSSRSITINLDRLSDELARELLRERSGWTGELPIEAKEILERCAGLPLALALIGAQLYQAPRRRWSHLRDRLKESNLKAIAIKLHDYDKHASLYEAIHASVAELECSDRDRYLDIAAFPDDTVIPEAVFETLWQTDPFETLDRWVDLSLATRDAEERINFHDLQLAYARSQHENTTALHARFVQKYEAAARGNWISITPDGYIHRMLPTHLVRAGRADDAQTLLMSFDWLEAKLHAVTDPNLLIADYTSLFPGDAEVERVGHALRLSAHVLAHDPGQLASQLAGRICFEVSALRGRAGRRWLEPVRATLTQPGEGLIRTIELGRPLSVFALSPDGRTALAGDREGVITLWEVASGARRREIKAFGSTVSAAVFAPGGNWFAAASSFGEIRTFHTASGNLFDRFRGFLHEVDNLAISPDGSRLTASSLYDEELRVYEIASARMSAHGGYGSGLRVATLSSDGSRAGAFMHGGTLVIADTQTGTILRSLEGFDDVRRVRLNDSGTNVISMHADAVRLTNVPTGREIWRGEHYADNVMISESRKRVVSVLSGSIQLWTENMEKLLGTLQAHSTNITAITTTPDGSLLVSASFDGSIRIWDFELSPAGIQVNAHKTPVVRLLFSADGSLLVSADTEGGVKVWRSASGEQIAEYQMPAGWTRETLALTDDGCKVLKCTAHPQVWSMVDGTVEELGGSPFIEEMSYSENRRILVLERYEDGPVTAYWPRGRAGGFSHSMLGIRDGSDLLYPQTRGESIIVKHFDSENELCRFTADHAISATAISFATEFVACGDSSGRVHILRLW